MGEKKSFGFDLGSKFWRTFLTLFSVLLIFGGPTYVVLVFWKVLDLDYAFSMILSFVLFIIGLVLLLYLISKKVIS